MRTTRLITARAPQPVQTISAKRLASLTFAALLMGSVSACGGGGGGTPTPAPAPIGGTPNPTPSPAPAPTPSPPAGQATATLVTPANGKTAWNIVNPIAVTLKDSAGNTVASPLACASANPAALTVSPDCSSITGKRLGNQLINVSAAGVSANATVKVIPQPQPVGTQGASSGGDYNLVVTPAGKVMAWGSNSSGKLGQGQTAAQLEYVALPVMVKDQTGQADLTGVVAVSGGTGSALALTEDGEVWSWGDNNNSILGRVAPNGDPLPGKVRNPADNGVLTGIVSVSIGDENAVALGDDGSVYSWGFYSGQTAPDPKRVPGTVNAVGGGALTGAVQVSAGWNWSAALLADGRVVTWGFSSDARTGQGIVSSSPGAITPGYVLRESDNAQLTGIVSLSAGYNFGTALTADGQIYAWGDNGNGQLGQNTQNDDRARAVLVKGVAGTGLLSNIKMVTAGGIHALAMDNDGKVFSWGYSQNGQLGDGANHPRVNQSPLPDAVVSANGTGQLSAVTAIFAGYTQSLALMSDGSLLIWGGGFRGGLGQGGTSSTDLFVPTPVKDAAGTGQLSLGPLSAWPNLLRRGR
jgi:alpha-tubulin suppressor-like RCC1 family protein